MEEKYNYLEKIVPLLLAHGMYKDKNIIFCKLPDVEIAMILEFMLEGDETLNSNLINYINSVKKDDKYLADCFRGEQLRLELNQKAGFEYYVYDMYRLLEQLDKYLKNNKPLSGLCDILKEFKSIELKRNTIGSIEEGSFLIKSRRGIFIQ